MSTISTLAMFNRGHHMCYMCLESVLGNESCLYIVPGQIFYSRRWDQVAVGLLSAIYLNRVYLEQQR